MKIQGRLTLGIGVLFAMILLLGIQSVSYVRQLSRATGTILADNYNSLQYAGDMLRSLNDIGQDSVSRHALRQSLALQQQNITEVSEKELTAALQQHVASLSDPVTEAEIQTVRADLYRIMEVNMAAIRAKSSQVEERADYVMWWLIVVAALCALVAGAVLVWFPRMVLRPIDELKKGIKEIASHNYGKRLDFTGNREFESVAESFNNMAAKLDEYRRSSLDDLMTAKTRIEAIVNSLHEPIIGLDPRKTILFMNREALSVLNLPETVIGRDAAEVALANDLLRRLLRELYGEKKNAGQEPLKIYADNKESYFQMEDTPLYIMPVGSREQQFVGNLIVLNNITKYKELDSAKTNFISTVSHEMKTPISSILMSLQLLGDNRLGPLNEEQKQLVGSIRESSDRLLNITGELLNMTQVESGKLRLMPKVVKPVELIDYAVKATQVLAERFRCFVEVEYPEKISKLFVDNEKIAWVITNLLSNAIHHSPRIRASSSGPCSMKRRSRFSCRISDGASTRVTIRAFSSVISACRVPKCRAAGWGWPSPRSLSRRTAVRSRSKAGSAREAAFRSCCRHSALPGRPLTARRSRRHRACGFPVFVCPDGIVRCGDGRRQRERNKIRIFPGFLRIYLFCLLQTANYRRKKLV